MKKLSLNIYIEKNILREINFNLRSKSSIKIKLGANKSHKKNFFLRGGSFLGRNFPGGNFPGGIFPGGIFPRIPESILLKERE